MRPSVCIALVVLVLPAVQTFVPEGSGNTHVTITKRAVMKKIFEVCDAVAESEERRFEPTGSTEEEILNACLGTSTGEVSGTKFLEALNQIYMQHGILGRDYASSNPHHFNNEAFKEGHSLISQGVAAVKANIREDNLQAARETLGRVLHTLQDFYSHSNWVELGYKNTYANLIKPDLTIDNVADLETPTCSDCPSGTCPNPLLPSILKEKKLTSGYMGLNSPNKPKGKCSHGGSADLSSTQVPRGGINKDEPQDNAALHDTAVALAIDATADLLGDVRGAVGNQEYLWMMGIARTAVLCFVIDTTSSMSEDIAEAKRVAHSIIDRKKGTSTELNKPSEYILVPFNDPSFGPPIRTKNPDIMKSEISKLTAAGGGDEPDMCLSALQLALTEAPAFSHIYVFTDASAKDTQLTNNIIALIRNTKSTVSFFMTKRPGIDLATQGLPDFQVYYNLALASGGQAIEVTKANLPNATDIILDTSTAALVTVLQQARIPGRVENFPFLLDASLSDVTAYLTGNNLSFTLYNPSGLSQPHTVSHGPLATIQTVGNLRRVHFNFNETGLWRISMESTEAYTIKVTGQSATSFIYDFVEEFSGPHSGYALIEGLPQKDLPKLLLTITGQKGAEALNLQEVALVEVLNDTVINGTIEEMGGGNFLFTANQVPEGEFVVMIKGEDKTTSSDLQRQTTTQMSLSKVIIRAVVDSAMVPGKEFEVPFTVSTNGDGGVFTITAKNDKDFPLKYNPKLTVNNGGNALGTVKVTPPENTTSGTDVTLTILAEGPTANDSNYAALRLSVLAEVTDFSPPKCEIVGVSPLVCPSDCIQSNWEMSVNITDGNGTGIEKIHIQKGNGVLTYYAVEDRGITVVVGLFKASCCSPDVIISAVDKEGNVGRCSYTMQRSGGVSSSLSLPLWTCLLVSALSIMRDQF